MQAEELIFRQAGFHFGTDEIEYLRDRLDRMKPTELHSLEHAFAQLNAVERGNLEERQRAVDLHLLIVAATKGRVAATKDAVSGMPSTDAASTAKESTGEESASEKKVELGETKETADE